MRLRDLVLIATPIVPFWDTTDFSSDSVGVEGKFHFASRTITCFRKKPDRATSYCWYEISDKTVLGGGFCLVTLKRPGVAPLGKPDLGHLARNGGVAVSDKVRGLEQQSQESRCLQACLWPGVKIPHLGPRCSRAEPRPRGQPGLGWAGRAGGGACLWSHVAPLGSPSRDQVVCRSTANWFVPA